MLKKVILISCFTALVLCNVACGGPKEDKNKQVGVSQNKETEEKKEDMVATFEYDYNVLEDGTLNLYGYQKEGEGVICEIPSEIDGKKVTSLSTLFSKENELTKVIIPDTVTVIGKNTFAYAESIEEIVIPDSITTVEESAFIQCQKIEVLRFGPNVTYVGNLAFVKCPDLKELHLPESVNNGEVNMAIYDMNPDFVLYAPAGSYLEGLAKEVGVAFQAE